MLFFQNKMVKSALSLFLCVYVVQSCCQISNRKRRENMHNKLEFFMHLSALMCIHVLVFLYFVSIYFRIFIFTLMFSVFFLFLFASWLWYNTSFSIFGLLNCLTSGWGFLITLTGAEKKTLF